MLSLEPELGRLREEGLLDDSTAVRLIAVERRDVVSVYAELRLLTWAGVMLVSWGVGLYISKHLKDIGPVAIVSIIGLASLGCYAWCFFKRGRAAALVDDYILLLAALLASADLGYVEHVYNLLGSSWPRHFLLLAVLHAVIAYIFKSRLVLSLSIASLAAWLGIEHRTFDAVFDAPIETAMRAFVCAAIVVVWRLIDRAVRRETTFSTLFDHSAANLAFWGGVTLAVHDDTRLIGCAITIALAVAATQYARRMREGTFVIYAWVYGTIAIDNVVCDALKYERELTALYLVISTIAAIVGLWISHARLRRTA